MYVERFYRRWVENHDLRRFQVKIRESDLLILCDHILEAKACAALAEVRRDIEAYVAADNRFLTSLEPVRVADEDAPAVILRMAAASRLWNVGPMAAVAGAVAQHVGERLATSCATVIVENGGDVYARMPGETRLRFALYAGEESPFSDKLAFEVDATDGIGVCTSSGRVGPSLSCGRADAVVAIADDTAEADAAATSIANQIREPGDVDDAVRAARSRHRLRGVIACAGDRLGMWGDLEIVGLEGRQCSSTGGLQ